MRQASAVGNLVIFSSGRIIKKASILTASDNRDYVLIGFAKLKRSGYCVSNSSHTRLNAIFGASQFYLSDPGPGRYPSPNSAPIK